MAKVHKITMRKEIGQCYYGNYDFRDIIVCPINWSWAVFKNETLLIFLAV